MAKLLYRIGRWAYRRKWWVIVAWILLLAGVATAAMTFMKPFSSDFDIDGTPSIDATKMLVENFPDSSNPVTAASVNIVFKAPEGETLEDPSAEATVDGVIHDIETRLDGQITDTERFGNPVDVTEKLSTMLTDQMTSAGLPEASVAQDVDNLRMVSPDGRIGYTSFAFDVPSATQVTDEHRAAVDDAIEAARDAGFTVEVGGPGFGEPIQVEATSEVIGLGVAFVVLLFTFGSLIAAGLPLLSAIIGVGTGVLLIVFTNAFVELNDITPTLALMIGLAVGIDYALFILSRYRSERRRLPNDEAAGVAVGTAGSAVVFAAVTVIIALAALTVAQINFLSWMGLTAASTVFIAMLVAITFIPALLGAIGDHAFGVAIPGVAGNPKKNKKNRAAGDTEEKPGLGRRWVTFVHKAPGLILAVVVIGLGVLTLPAAGLQLSLPSDSTSNVDTTQRKSADLMAEGFGPGVNAPFLLIVDARGVNPDAQALRPYVAAQRTATEAPPEDPEADPAANPEEGAEQAPAFDEGAAAAMSSFIYTTDQISSMVGVKHAQIAGLNGDMTSAQILVTPETGPIDEETVALADALRTQAASISNATGAVVGLTGFTAVQMDITELLEEAMPIYLSIVVGLAIVLLLLVFRSIMVPIVAGLGFLLSVGAAFGVTVLFWQEGLWGLVSSPGPLVSFMPIFLIGVTFGLAMDYQVFLVTRMREHYTHNNGQSQPGSPYTGVEEATIEGFSEGARVVTAAALIMISVFIAFVNQPLPFIQIFGFALGVGILFDAFLIRMTLVPASMFILGRGTWWIPKWLDKILPSLDVEGSALERDVIPQRVREQEERQQVAATTGRSPSGGSHRVKE